MIQISSLRMRRNCNLELRLSPTATATAVASDHPSAAADGTLQSQQQLTIFYNGRICVCDVTELQASAILKLASRETEEMDLNETTSSPIVERSPAAAGTPTAPGLSMKRSLQRFLQKRKHRVQATSPYNH